MNNFQVMCQSLSTTLLWAEEDFIEDDGVSADFDKACRRVVIAFIENIESDMDAFREDEDWDALAIAATARVYVEKNPAQAGHDLWLTSQHHGVGFWDRGHGEMGEYLTNVAKKLGVEFDGAEPRV